MFEFSNKFDTQFQSFLLDLAAIWIRSPGGKRHKKDILKEDVSHMHSMQLKRKIHIVKRQIF